jgi:hypothetical protein
MGASVSTAVARSGRAGEGQDPCDLARIVASSILACLDFEQPTAGVAGKSLNTALDFGTC